MKRAIGGHHTLHMNRSRITYFVKHFAVTTIKVITLKTLDCDSLYLDMTYW